MSLRDCRIPAIWKKAIILPIPKPGKDLCSTSSNRPVSLLSPVVKLMERAILPQLQKSLPIPDYQHGFKKGHSCITALLPLVATITEGFNKPKPPGWTVLVATDLSKAFDTVPTNLLIKKLLKSPLNPGITRWIAGYLRGRQGAVRYRDCLSTYRTVRSGVPQGGGGSCPRLSSPFFLADNAYAATGGQGNGICR